MLKEVVVAGTMVPAVIVVGRYPQTKFQVGWEVPVLHEGQITRYYAIVIFDQDLRESL